MLDCYFPEKVEAWELLERRLFEERVERLKKTHLKPEKLICFYCGKLGNTKDHYIPKSKGGRNKASNYVYACAPCNTLKSNLMPEEFYNKHYRFWNHGIV